MRVLPAIMLGSVLLCGAAGAAEKATNEPVRELEPVHVKAIRDPEVRKYKAVLAGLDAFDKHHAMAPGVDKLRFLIELRRKGEATRAPAVRLVGDGGFKMQLPLDATGRFTVPRSEAAKDADSELELNQKRRLYRVLPDIRTPGLPANQRRLGDLRLECKVQIAIIKAEIPLFWVLTINGFFVTTDWCSVFGDEKSTAYGGAKKEMHFGYQAGQPLERALLLEGKRSALLQVKGETFEVPIGNSSWSDEAIVELTFAQAAAGTATGTAAETPQTEP